MKTGEFNPWGPLARLSARMRGQTVEVTVEANLWRVLDVDIP